MNTTQYSDLIRSRKSCRSYLKKAVRTDQLGAIRDYWDTLGLSPFGDDLHFAFLQQRVGTYGLLKNPPTFVVGTGRLSPTFFLSYGYLIEHIVLHMVGMGLGTCWVGGYRTGSQGFDVDIPDGYQTGAVVAFGYPAEKKAIVERTIHSFIQPRKRKLHHELFFEDDFNHPAGDDISGRYADVFEMVRIAPSAANKQPWRLVATESFSTVHFFLQRTTASKVYERKHLQQIDIGIAMCHFDLALRDSHIGGEWRIDDPGITSPQAEYVASWKKTEGLG